MKPANLAKTRPVDVGVSAGHCALARCDLYLPDAALAALR